MDWLNLWRLESDFLANWCLGNRLIDRVDFRGCRLLAFYWSAQLGRQGRNRARRRNGGYCAGACACARSRARARTRAANSPRVGFALEIPHVAFERRPEVPGSTPEFGHHFAKISGQLREFFGAKNYERHNENNNQMWDA
jgi:hypothetical protein